MEEDNCQVKFLESFVDIDTINNLIDNVSELNEDACSISKAEVLFQNFSTILDKYQEQPHLMDPFLRDLVDKLISIVKKTHNEDKLAFHTAFQCLYHLTKVRGPKVIIRYLPNTVEDAQPVIRMINSQSNSEIDHWQTKYILLIWLSILVLLPFHLERFDAVKGDHSLTDVIYEIITTHLCKTAKYSDAAAFLAAKFLTRPETVDIYLSKFIDWSLIQIKNHQHNSPLLALFYIFKFGKREEINKLGPSLYSDFANIDVDDKLDDMKFKLIVKLVQRIALSYLKAKVASWRYQRGRRFLTCTTTPIDNSIRNEPFEKDHLLSTDRADSCSKTDVESTIDDDDYLDVDEEKLNEISKIVGFLLSALKHRNADVRWSAAKGLGRITERLSKDLAEDIIDSVTDLFCSYQEESTWHGACLSVAELAIRGLILPEKLPELLPLISRALIYEELRGNFTTGKLVRDSACFVCWAFARAFEPSVIRPFVDSIATTLITVAVFDKEVIIRRAAAAAFQENVGRQGTFPNGIDIVTTVDHSSVQLINKSYLDVSPRVAQFDAYRLPLIEHLVEYKIRHSDSMIRELAARALHNLTIVVEDSMIIEHALNPLLELCDSSNYKERHGAILALAQLFHALVLKKSNALDRELISKRVEQILLKISNNERLTGQSGESTRHALCVLIEKCALCELRFNQQDDVVDKCSSFIKSGLVHSDAKQRKYTIDAFKPFSDFYLNGDRSRQDDMLAYLIVEVKNGTEDAKLGALNALSNLPSSIFEPDTPSVLVNTILSFLRTGSLSNKNLALIRSKAIQCINAILMDIDQIKLFTLTDNIEEFLSFCMLDGANDYTVLSMKDIGHYVRTESISALARLMIYFIDQGLHKGLVKRNFLAVLSAILPQCVSPNDILRIKSSNYFHELVKRSPVDSDEYTKLKMIFQDVKDEYTFKEYSTSFGLFVQLFDFDCFRTDLWKGYVLTTGGFENSSVNYSREALSNYLKQASCNKLLFESIMHSLYQLLLDQGNDPKYPITIIKTYDYLFNTNILDSLNKQLLMDLQTAVWNQIRKSDDVKKISAGSVLICSMLRFKELRNQCLSKLIILICSRFPNVRCTTADTLYSNLLIFGDLILEENEQEKLEELMTLLSETVWSKSDSLSILKETRKRICQLLNIPEPIVVTKKSTQQPVSVANEN